MSRFIQRLKQRVAKDMRNIVLPEGDSRRVLQAAEQVAVEGFARPILVGKEEIIKRNAALYTIDLSGVRIVDPETSPDLEECCAYFAKQRAKAGMTVAKAQDILRQNPVFFGAALVALDKADGMVAGATLTSADVIRAALQVIGIHPGIHTVSSSFVMITEAKQFGDHGIFVLGDASVVVKPTPEQLADIAENCVDRARRTVQLLDPKVALLSYSTLGSGSGEEIDLVRQALHILRERHVDFDVDGELQSDAALSPRVARQKAPGSTVAGQANVLIFPNLVSANICYKMIQQLTGATALGPLLQGLNKPVMDLSRGCTKSEIVDIIAICCSDVSHIEESKGII